MAAKCGIPVAAFLKINSGEGFCVNMKPKQHVCCTMGTMPDFSPKKNADGSCYAYQIIENDNCDTLAAEYSLTKEKIESYNKKTWGFSGCDPLYKETVICLSEGEPPFPSSISNAVCGPRKPGSVAPTDGSDIAELNPCPLNACCNIWGQCGITTSFCVDTNTGNPGTAAEGTFGRTPNCGTDTVKGTGSGDIRIGYFEGYNIGRKCLFQDAAQIDTSKYTHIHFGFGTLTPNYTVEVGDVLSSYQFEEFKKIKNIKRILSFGGWDFSTMPDTYFIFREGVKPANRLKMATSIAEFIKKHDLDGVDIDWEYPGAPDLPDIPPADEDDGKNYLAFLVILRNLLPLRTVSIAAPASYWYLKQYPIKEIGKVINYIVYMTYDLHGQWDANNGYSQDNCDQGNCLRSQVNLTETKQSLAMITKAGVPGNKVVVGITSYGRSFNMAEEGCWGPSCTFTGDRLTSHATKGVCTDTAGYIADAEIAEIMGNKKRADRVAVSFVDSSSNSDILVYDNTQWVSYMSASTKKSRATLYKAWGLAGTTDWATDLAEYHDAPKPATSWNDYKQKALNGDDPKIDLSRDGNWTDYDCTDEVAVCPLCYYPERQWSHFNVEAAWKDVVRIWKETDKDRDWKFSQSVSSTLHIVTAEADCQKVDKSNCDDAVTCEVGLNSATSGPAGKLIWNSLVWIHQVHTQYLDYLLQMTTIATPSMFCPANEMLVLLLSPASSRLFPLFKAFTDVLISASRPH